MSAKLNAIRWWAFRKLSAIGWAVCPQPQRGEMQSVMPSWESVRRIRAIHQREAQRDAAITPAEDDKAQSGMGG